MNRRRVRLRRILGLATVIALAIPAGAQAIPAPWPGLPEVPGRAQWFGIQGNGISAAARAEQWIKIPAQAVALADTIDSTTFPSDDPQHRLFVRTMRPLIFLSSPAGADHGYGVGLPITVRTVAFGAIPVQAKVQLEQVRDADGLPKPLTGDAAEEEWTTPQQVRPGFSSTNRVGSMHLTGQVRLRVADLAVDGVDLHLGSGCQAGPIDLDLDGAPAWRGDPLSDINMEVPPITWGTASATWMAEHGEGIVGQGGAVSGNVDIPAFAGCRTRTGEDVSRLLTAAISGPGNRVQVGFPPMSTIKCGSQIPPYNFQGPRKPFAGDPSDCDPTFAPPKFSYPARSH